MSTTGVSCALGGAVYLNVHCVFYLSRCLYEIFSCARYLAGQGDIASGNMVAVMSKQDLKTMNVPDIVKQLRNKCTQEGKVLRQICESLHNTKKEVKKTNLFRGFILL